MNDLATLVIERASARGLTIAAAESCTGGLIGAALTDVPGASAVFTHGVVSYANEAKRDLLGVPMDLIVRRGAVSREVAEAMARGAGRRFGTDLAVSVTGIAGPGGGSADKPVGLVWFGLYAKGRLRTERRVFQGGRAQVRAHAVNTALRLLLMGIEAEERP